MGPCSSLYAKYGNIQSTTVLRTSQLINYYESNEEIIITDASKARAIVLLLYMLL